MTELSLGVKEGYDDNLFGVSGHGMQPQRSWFTTVSPKVAFDFAPLFGSQSAFTTLSLNYSPDLVRFHEAPSENYDAHKFGSALKGGVGAFSFSLDDSFLYNDGSKVAPTYALNQLSGAAANQFDKYRNYFAQEMAYLRRNQIQERANAVLQYDLDQFFVRPTASLLDYNLDTAFHNTGSAPYKGYQNYVDRSDVNGGADLGYKVLTNAAVTMGYRYGSQFQQPFAPAITSDSHYSSSTYQRALLGFEGKPVTWLSVKLDGGPDFRDYNSHTPVSNLHPTKYYGEASVSARISTNQSVAFDYKQWNWVANTGFVPVFVSSYGINYHWNVTRRLGFDLGAKIQEYDYTGGNDYAGTAPSARADRLYSVSPGLSFAISPQLSASVRYSYNAGNNELRNLPSADQAAYRNYTENLVSVGLAYKF